MIDSSDPCAAAMIVAQHDLELMLKEPLPHGPLLLTDCINLAKVGLILLKAIDLIFLWKNRLVLLIAIFFYYFLGPCLWPHGPAQQKHLRNESG